MILEGGRDMNSIIHSFPGKMDFASGERLQFASQIFKALKDLNKLVCTLHINSYNPKHITMLAYICYQHFCLAASNIAHCCVLMAHLKDPNILQKSYTPLEMVQHFIDICCISWPPQKRSED